jgi:hypothetical protein
MPKTDQATNPTRRTILARLPAAALASSAVLSTAALAVDRDADAELIRLCAEHDQLERQRLAIFETGPKTMEGDRERDKAIEPITDKQEALLARFHPIQATTFAGIVARARTLILWDPEILDVDEGCCPDEILIAGLLRDILAMAEKA